MITAVVLAAGASTRMGTHKLLLPIAGEPLVRRTVREVAAAGFDDVLVVVGFEHARVLAALEGMAVRHAVNADYATGLGSSFRTAVAALGTSEAAMFALADQPFVTAREYRTVLDTYRKNPSGIVCVRYGEVTAPPHLFDRAFFGELGQLEHGARPGTAATPRRDDGAGVPARPAARRGYAGGLRTRGRASGRRAVKAVDAAVQESAFEAATHGEDFAHDRHGDLLRCFRAQREADGVAHALEH